MRVSVIIFPGSNCDHDVEHVYRNELGQTVNLIWHRETDLKKPDLVVLPGGFSYGDYLRTGAMAKLSPAMKEVAKFAKKGGPVLGICNGFQILCEAGLLPGALLRNYQRKFLSQFVHLRVESANSFFTKSLKEKSIVTCPIAHGEGNYFADEKTIEALEDKQRVLFRYVTADGKTSPEANPNGSLHHIAGICNEARNVIGLMPHPERSSEGLVGWIGGQSGRALFESTLAA